MKNELIKSFEEGLEFVVKTIISGRERPVIVSIIGNPDSGKTKLRSEARERLAALSIFGWQGMSEDKLEMIAQPTSITNPQYVLIEDVFNANSSDKYSAKLFGKYPDLRVYMFRKGSEINSGNLREIAQGVYGLVIENPHATVKNLYGNRGK